MARCSGRGAITVRMSSRRAPKVTPIVAQSPDPADARAKLVRYTAFGARGYRRAMAVFAELEQEHAERLGPARIARLKADLKLIAEALTPVSAAVARLLGVPAP
jgi:hypothetical protein